MTYPVLINGALINGDAEGGETEGIDLVLAGVPRALGAMVVGGVVALELGTPKAGDSIAPEGIDLVAHETDNVLVFNVDLTPEGLELATTGSHVARLTINHVGAHALELGDHAARIGTDVEARPAGIDLVRGSLHTLQAGPVVPSNTTLLAAGARPLELGALSIGLGAITITAGGAHALDVGAPGLGLGLQVAGVHAMEPGDPGTVRLAITTASGLPMELGVPHTATALSIEGIDLARVGQHATRLAAITLTAGGYLPMEVGEPGQSIQSLRARQHFPMALGQPSISRGNAC